MNKANLHHDKPLISVIIPCHNPTTLCRTLNSVCNQNYPYWEALCVDDGSDKEFSSDITAMNDWRISYHRLDEHSNANVARNYGIEHSQGEYIAMLDSDDEWMESHLKDSIDVLLEKEVDGVYGSLIIRDMKRDSICITRERHLRETMIDFLLSTGYGAQTSTLVMTASSAKDIQWDETLKRHQDYDFLVRYSQKYNLCPIINPTVIYHQSNGLKLIDFDSCIRFIRTVENDISDHIYTNYHIQMLRLAIYNKASENTIAHYRRQATYYNYLLSLYEYLKILQPNHKIGAWCLKMRYIWNMFLIDIE